jgi:hypothetical protein
VAGESVAQETAVLREHLRVFLGTELVQELRRAIHVGEEEGDSSGRKFTAHGINDAPEANLCHGASGLTRVSARRRDQRSAGAG